MTLYLVILSSIRVNMTNTNKDQHLLALLRENARLAVSELARKLCLSRTATQARLTKLEITVLLRVTAFVYMMSIVRILSKPSS